MMARIRQMNDWYIHYCVPLPHTKFLDLPLPLCGPSDTFLWPKGARAPDFLTCWLRPKGGQRKDKLLIPFQGHSVAHCFCEKKFTKVFDLPKTMKKFTKLQI